MSHDPEHGGARPKTTAAGSTSNTAPTESEATSSPGAAPPGYFNTGYYSILPDCTNLKYLKTISYFTINEFAQIPKQSGSSKEGARYFVLKNSSDGIPLCIIEVCENSKLVMTNVTGSHVLCKSDQIFNPYCNSVVYAGDGSLLGRVGTNRIYDGSNIQATVIQFHQEERHFMVFFLKDLLVPGEFCSAISSIGQWSRILIEIAPQTDIIQKVLYIVFAMKFFHKLSETFQTPPTILDCDGSHNALFRMVSKREIIPPADQKQRYTQKHTLINIALLITIHKVTIEKAATSADMKHMYYLIKNAADEEVFLTVEIRSSDPVPKVFVRNADRSDTVFYCAYTGCGNPCGVYMGNCQIGIVRRAADLQRSLLYKESITGEEKTTDDKHCTIFTFKSETNAVVNFDRQQRRVEITTDSCWDEVWRALLYTFAIIYSPQYITDPEFVAIVADLDELRKLVSGYAGEVSENRYAVRPGQVRRGQP